MGSTLTVRALTQSEWSQLVQAVQAGDRIRCDTILADAGDACAELGLAVATDETLAGRTANRYLAANNRSRSVGSLNANPVNGLTRDTAPGWCYRTNSGRRTNPRNWSNRP